MAKNQEKKPAKEKVVKASADKVVKPESEKTETTKAVEEAKKPEVTETSPETKADVEYKDEISPAAEKEETQSEPDTSKEPYTQMSFEEADVQMDLGKCIALPLWHGFWFKKEHNGPIYLLTKDNEVLDTPMDEYKESNEWQVVEPTEEQSEVIANYFENLSQRECYDSLTAVAYNNGSGTTFRKVMGKVSVSELESRTGDVNALQNDAEILMSNGQVFSYAESRLTNRFEKELLKQFKK